MRTTRIVTSFVKDNDKFLLLKRSNKVKSMKGLWAGISGVIEKDEEPIKRAKIEIFEEIGLTDDKIKFLRASSKMKVHSPQYENHEWEIFPFLFEVKEPEIKLNWENSEYRWITVDEIGDFQTVPSIEKVLLSLL